MAKARSILPKQPTIELLLTDEEARFLQDVMQHIGGSPESSRRRFANGLSFALSSVGVPTADSFNDILPGTCVKFKDIQ